MLKRFELEKNQTNVSTEFFGGLATFLASFYIIIVNPSMLSQAGLPYSAVLTGTIMIAAFATILMGFYANNPILLAPGMGLNAFFTFSVVVGEEIHPEVALGIVFWSGILFLILSILKIREKIIHIIPQHLRYAISCGIGLFITFIGFEKGSVIVHHPATLVQMAPLSPMVFTFFICLFVSGFLVYKKVRGSLVLGILFTFLLSIPLGRLYGTTQLIEWKGFISSPDFSWFGRMNLIDSFKLSLLPTILAFMFTDMFDTISTLVGVSHAGNLLDEKGHPRNIKKSLVVDAIATTLSGLFGTSPTTSFIESAAGIQQGARTGLSSVFAGLMFLPFLFIAPLISMFPVFTTAPILVIVGLFMMGPIIKIEWHKFEIALPSFLSLILIPLTFSITQGMIAGLACHYFFVILRKGYK
jgi:adenine/guanine/hypoxanthine permease